MHVEGVDLEAHHDQQGSRAVVRLHLRSLDSQKVVVGLGDTIGAAAIDMVENLLAKLRRGEVLP